MVKTVRAAHLHFNLRWLGCFLLISGVLLLSYFLVQVFGTGALLHLILSFVSCGLSLGSFGINHDTAVAYALRARDEGVLLTEHPVLQRELTEDLERDKIETMSLKPHSILSYVIPCIALALQGYLWSTIFNS